MTKTEAHQIGRDIKSQLGKDWIIQVDENLGWFVHVYSPTKHLYVYPVVGNKGEKTEYSCLMTSDPKRYLNCGEPLWSNIGHYPTPVEAVLAQLKAAQEAIRPLQEAIYHVQNAASQFTCECCGKKRLSHI